MATYDTTFDIDAPIAQVWSALTDFPRYGDWNTFLPSLTGEPHVGSTLAIALVLGEGVKPMNVGAKILALDQEHRFTWQGNLGADLLFKGFREFTLESLGSDKTEVRHVESITGRARVPCGQADGRRRAPPRLQHMPQGARRGDRTRVVVRPRSYADGVLKTTGR